MKKTFLYSVLFATILLVASCEKEKVVVDYLPATISNYQGMGGTKVYIDNGNYACWSPSGDVVKLNSDNANVVAQRDGHFKIAVATPADEYVAIFPANAVTDAANHSVTLPAIQHYEEVSLGENNEVSLGENNNVQKVNALMAAKGTTRLDFKNICALLKVTVSGIPSNAHLTFIEVSHSDMALSGTGTVTFSSTGEPSLSMATSGSKMIKLQFDENGHDNGDYYITVPPVTGKFTVRISYRAQDANGVIQLYTKTFKQNSSCTLNANEIGPVAAANVGTTPVEHLPGAFSTGNGVVYFSRGSLKFTYNNSVATWGFENNQYSTTTYSASGNGQNQVVDHSGYFPWSSQNGREFPILSNTHQTNNFYDWGMHFTQTGETQHWKTLNRAQWKYIMEQRSASKLSNKENARFVYAKVNTVNGLMLFPDLFSWPTTLTENPPSNTIINSTVTSWDNAPSYNLTQWKELEDAGCVFLPARGYWPFNNPANPPVNDGQGYYWTSESASDGNGYYMYFAPSSTPTYDDNVSQYGNGYLVRIVYQY